MGIDVNGSVTPITGKDVPDVRSYEWENLTLTELYEQLSALQSRRMMLIDMHKSDLVPTIDHGIMYLEHYIKSRAKDEETFL